ncbi:MAG: nickel-responsive transcriptional regulator NikR [Deferribacterales bacterium]|nr:nickel-responsive transcriptional regulator NikR [Deferribacterales bacterium]
MSALTRFGVSLDKKLLETFDKHIKKHSYETRSKAIADLIKDYIDSEVISQDGIAAGVVSFMYDHHNRDTVSRLLDIQHSVHDVVISMQHIHLDHHNCLEILAVRGSTGDIRQLYHSIKALKGIKLASVSVTAVEEQHNKENSK